jgi:hypothetical protein
MFPSTIMLSLKVVSFVRIKSPLIVFVISAPEPLTFFYIVQFDFLLK